MTSASDKPSPLEPTLGQLPWLRRLALQLVGDPDLADDLAQDTWLLAMERPPSDNRNLRGWLARVLRNLLFQEHRDRGRRERATQRADPQLAPSAAEVAADLQTQRRVVAALETLDEPYRTVLHMRYYRDLPPREIARLRDAPVATINSQLARGLKRLRCALEDRHGGGRFGWCAPWLTELTQVAGSSAGGLATAGALTMKKSIVAAVTVVVLGLVGGYAAWPEPESDRPLAYSADPADPELAQTTTVASDSKSVERVEVVSGVADGPIEGAVFRGHLIAVDGVPLEEVTVGFSGTDDVARSVADGSFELPVPEASRTIRVREAGWTTVLEARVGVNVCAQASTPLVVAARAVQAAGLVVDGDGRPVDGATVWIRVPRSLRVGIDQPLDTSHEIDWRTTTDEAGRFELGEIGAVVGAEICARADGVAMVQQAAPQTDDDAIHIVLARPDRRIGVLHGQVVDPDGYPVAGANVVLGRTDAISAADGTFALELRPSFSRRDLYAVQRGYRPAHFELKDWAVAPEDSSPPFVTLWLGASPGEISGTVVNAAGMPVEGVKVWAEIATSCGLIGGSLATLEGYLGGGQTRSEMRSIADATGRDLDTLVQERPSAQWGFVWTDPMGRFQIGGLLAEEYELGVLVTDTLATQVAGPFVVGTTAARITLDAGGVLPRVAGVVVGLDGLPIPAVAVTVRLWPYDVRYKDARATLSMSTPVSGERTRTDDEGRFELRNVGAFALLRFEGEGIVPKWVGGDFRVPLVDALGGVPEQARIELSRRLHLRVELTNPNSATAFRVSAGEGFQAIHKFSGDMVGTVDRVQFDNGGSEVVAVGEAVDTVVLLQGDVEVARVPITPVLGEVTTVIW